jgi:cell division protease FtsH
MGNQKWLKNRFVQLALIIAGLLLFYSLLLEGGSNQSNTHNVPISQVLREAAAKPSPLKEIQLSNVTDTIRLKYKDGSEKISRRELLTTGFTRQLVNAGYDVTTGPEVTISEASAWTGVLGLLTFLLPTVVIIGVLVFMMRGTQGGNSQAFSFAKSKARLFDGSKPSVTFADVAGVEEAKQELAEIVEFLKYPDKFAMLGARIPRGVLLVGPPGTGKTLISKAVAGEAGVPFFNISGSEFVEMFVGVGASRVRDLFDQAKRHSPCIVFVDEIDAVGRRRGSGIGGANDEREQTLNQLLVEMDGFDSNTNIIIIAATNRPDVLDPALLRPGRFDRQVIVDPPDLRGRIAILEVHSKGKPLEKEVSLETLARQTAGFTGADLANLTNEAAILAARRNRKTISMSELEESILRVRVGPERKSRVMGELQKAITAYHEVGHALVARMLPNTDPVHKISIIPRGMAAGLTMILPQDDRRLGTKSQFVDQITWGLGGRAAEELIFDEISSGASDDIEKATNLARQMVTQYGMSEKLGPLAFARGEQMVFLGGGIGEAHNYSERVAYQIDKEINSIIAQSYSQAQHILRTHRNKLIEIAELLIAKETLEGTEFEQLFQLERPQPRPLL